MVIWKNIAWNGLSLQTPEDWEIATIGKNYLMLGTAHEPKMEIAWTVSNKLSRKRCLAKLKKLVQNEAKNASVDSWVLSQDMLFALSSYEIKSFFWKNSQRSCYGLILFCLSCNRVSMIQLYQKVGDRKPLFSFLPEMLSSYKDHSEEGFQKLAVYDIKALIPENLMVKSYKFVPGFMEISFTGNKQAITFYRWSPAAILLEGRSLEAFGSLLSFHKSSASKKVWDDKRIGWEKERPVSLWKRLISRSHTNYRLHIRHFPEANRILAVKEESSEPLDNIVFDKITSQYGTH